MCMILTMNFFISYHFRKSVSGVNLISSTICSCFCVVMLPEDPSSKERNPSADVDIRMIKKISLLITSATLPIILFISWATYFVVAQVWFPGTNTDTDVFLTLEQYHHIMVYIITGLFSISVVSCFWYHISFNKETNEKSEIELTKNIRIPILLKKLCDGLILLSTLGLFLFAFFTFPTGPNAVVFTLKSDQGLCDITHGYTYETISKGEDCHMNPSNLVTCGKASLVNVESHQNLSKTRQEMVYFGELLTVTNWNKTTLRVFNRESKDLDTYLKNSVCIRCMSPSPRCHQIERHYRKCKNICTKGAVQINQASFLSIYLMRVCCKRKFPTMLNYSAWLKCNFKIWIITALDQSKKLLLHLSTHFNHITLRLPPELTFVV